MARRPGRNVRRPRDCCGAQASRSNGWLNRALAAVRAFRRQRCQLTPAAQGRAALCVCRGVAVRQTHLLTRPALAIVCLLWVVASQVLGVFYRIGDHAYKTEVAVVDFDGGAVGQAMLQTISSVNGQAQYPTFITIDANTTTADAVRQSVFDGDYWAAVIATSGATTRLQSALVRFESRRIA